MTAIPTPGSELRHVRKTITFTGGANAGLLDSDIPLFTTTGRVRIEGLPTVYVSTDLICAAGADTILCIGVAGASDWHLLAPVTTATSGRFASGYDYDFRDFARQTVFLYEEVSGNVILRPHDNGAGANITAGVVIVDCWYTPITDDGALVGDDIDSQLVDAIWDEAQSGHTTAGTFGRYLDSQLATIAGYIDTEVAAIKAKTDSLTFSVAGVVDANVTDWKGATAPAMTGDAYARLGAPAGASVSADVAAVQADTDNIQTRIPAALVGGRMDSSVGAMAAAVITAAAIATDAIDADALAADAVTEIWAKAMTELSAAPAVTGTVLQALEWIFLLARNKLTQTATTQTLRNDADNANLSTSTVSDDGTTFTRGEWS